MVDEELRKKIARIISPKACFEDFDGIQWSRFQMDRRRVAYEKADKVIAEIIGYQQERKTHDEIG